MSLNAEGTEVKISAVLFIPENADFCSGLLEKHVVNLEKSPALEKRPGWEIFIEGMTWQDPDSFRQLDPASQPPARRSPSLPCLSFPAHIK